MYETQEQWYKRMYEETQDPNYLKMLNLITKGKEAPKDLSDLLMPSE